MQIRIVASPLMKAKDVKRICQATKRDMDRLLKMLDLQIHIRNEIRRLKESESNWMVA